MRIGNDCTKKVLTATMNIVNLLAAGLGLTIATLGFHFYRELELPQGIDDMEHMMFSALAVGVFGLIITFTTLGGAYWLNNGSSQFKIAFCATIAVIAYALIIIRGILPQVEKTINDGMMVEYEKYFRNKISREIVDNCQRTHECCGYFGIEDFPEHRSIPESCCPPHKKEKYGYCSRKTAYIDPCRSKLGEIIDVYFNSMDVVCYITSSIIIALIIIVLVVVHVFKDEAFAKNRWKIH